MFDKSGCSEGELFLDEVEDFDCCSVLYDEDTREQGPL